ncbi:hypothetical protein BT96DRAFT_919254 [Gymnopus androsaceus JB14]|uniref:Uncharacterized protein n=1 Tax=Gymnopus androsaceus JB14 TaxID=1447944 RepID=A0A6A4HV34_9AGAR|nr:hypothetical protein BT96DRAFT_919254 [Gymnopus androsaceus JB14]
MNQAAPRAPSPLRQSEGIDPDLEDSDESDDDSDDVREQDSATSQFVNFAHRVTTLVGGIASPIPSPKEAQRERERGIREAERILQAESAHRSSLEDRVLAMLDSTRALPPPPSRAQTMPDPQSSQPSSPSSWWSAAKNRLTPTKDKDLTPAQQVIVDMKRSEKEREKAEKEYQKEIKRSSKGKDKDWPAVSENKFSDPAFLNLNVPQTPTPQHRRTGSPTSPSPNPPSSSARVLGSPSASGSPARSFTAPNLTPSPNRSTTSVGASPGRADQPPLYAQFNPQGGLDVHLTLITIAKRFEKLEKWTVGHVRALEERMGDVERWLVDKEEREQPDKSPEAGDRDLQGRIGELGREMAEMSRERAMEKVSPDNLSSSKQSHSATFREASPPPTASSFAPIESSTGTGADWPNLQSQAHKRVPSVRESTSPPLLRSLSRQTTGGRLPYPTGDYAPPPGPEAGSIGTGADTIMSGTFSPPVSPPGSLNSRTPTRKPLSGMGMPASSGLSLGLANANANANANAGPSGAPGMSSSASTYSTSYSNASFSSVSSISPSTSPSPSPRPPRAQAQASTSPSNTAPAPKGKSRVLPPVPPKDQPSQHSSSSPSGGGGRKRYTVAWSNGDEIHETYDSRDSRILPRSGSNSSIGRAFFSSSPVSAGRGGGEVDDDHEGGGGRGEDFIGGDETIGKSSSRSGLAAALKKDGDSKTKGSDSQFTPTHSRIRAQSAYGFSSIVQQSSQGSGGGRHLPESTSTPNMSGGGLGLGSTAPLKPRVRSQSTSPHPSSGNLSTPTTPSSSSKFVDPLVLRRQETENRHGKLAMPRPLSGKVPIGQLVKFFDGDKKK